MTDTATPAPTEAPPDADGSPQAPPVATPEAVQPDNAPTDATASGDTPAKPADAAGADETESKTPEDKRTVEQIADDYIVPLSDAAKQEWHAHAADYLPYAIETAKGLYPTLAPQLAKGLTTKTLVDPYVQVAKQLLGPGIQLDWTDPKWGKALDGGRTKDGTPAPMGLSDWRTLLQSDPQYGYDKTPQSHAVADNLASTIRSHFTGNADQDDTAEQASMQGAP